MPKLLILCGPPGSGKSSFSQSYVEQGYVYINQDSQGKQGHYDLFLSAIKEKKDIIIDRLNFDYHQRSRYLNLATESSYETEIIVLHQSYEECLKRMKAREGHPTISDEKSALSALNMFFSRYERPKEGEANKLTFMYPEGEKTKAIYCDLDGCLSNCEHRRHHVREDIPTPGFKKNWKAFFQGISDDPLNVPVANTVKAMAKEGYPIVFCSGRSDDYREITEQWLDKYGMTGINLDNSFHLFMRPRSDHRQDCIVKEILLDFEILPRFDILFCLDDRSQVVQMLRSRGLTVFQVANGDF